MSKFRLLLPLILLLIALGCGSSGGSSNEQVSERLRVVHAAPTLGKITILQDEKPIVDKMLYGTASEYIELDEATKSIFSIRVDPEFALPVLAVEEAVNGPYKKTLLVTESGGQPVFTFIADQTKTKLPADESRLRFVNAASIASAIDIYVTSPTTSLSGRSATVEKLKFLSTSSYFPATPGDYRIRVAVAADVTTPTDTTTAAAATKAPDIDFDSSLYPIDSGEEVTFYLLESRGGGRPYRSLTVRTPGD